MKQILRTLLAFVGSVSHDMTLFSRFESKYGTVLTHSLSEIKYVYSMITFLRELRHCKVYYYKSFQSPSGTRSWAREAVSSLTCRSLAICGEIYRRAISVCPRACESWITTCSVANPCAWDAVEVQVPRHCFRLPAVTLRCVDVHL